MSLKGSARATENVTAAAVNAPASPKINCFTLQLP
jgi:hypothetical protein